MSLLFSSTKKATPQQYGCLWGTFFGDASGFLVEKASPRQCKAYALNEWDRWWQHALPPTRTRFHFRAGQTSDDSCFSALLHLQLSEGWDPQAYWKRILDHEAQHGIVGMGKGTQQAIANARKHIPQPFCGSPHPSNGSIMRAAIIGTHAKSWQEAFHTGAEQALPTHRHFLSIEAAGFLAAFAYFLCTQEPLKAWDSALQYPSQWTSETFTRFLDNFPATDTPLETVLHTILETTPAPAQGNWQGISPYVMATLGWALWCFLRAYQDYPKLMFHIFSGGGDTDTTAAIASALYGIRHPDFLSPFHQAQLIS